MSPRGIIMDNTSEPINGDIETVWNAITLEDNTYNGICLNHLGR